MKAAEFRYPPALDFLAVSLPWDPVLVEAFKVLIPPAARRWCPGIRGAVRGHWEIPFEYRDAVRQLLRERDIPIKGDAEAEKKQPDMTGADRQLTAAEIAPDLLESARLLRGCLATMTDAIRQGDRESMKTAFGLVISCKTNHAKWQAGYREACEREAEVIA